MTVKNEINIFVRSENRTLANRAMNFSKYRGVGSVTMISAFIMAGSFVNRASLPECPDRDVRATDFHSWR
jgi:hypothetical protein